MYSYTILVGTIEYGPEIKFSILIKKLSLQSDFFTTNLSFVSNFLFIVIILNSSLPILFLSKFIVHFIILITHHIFKLKKRLYIFKY